MNSYTKFEENRSMNVQDRARKRNADGRTDRRTDRRTDGHSNANFFGGYNIIPRTFFKWRGIKSEQASKIQTLVKLVNVEWGEKLIKLSISVMLRSEKETKREIPSPNDIVLLTKHVESELKSLPMVSDNFWRCVQLMETRLLLFNKQRSGEIEGIR